MSAISDLSYLQIPRMRTLFFLGSFFHGFKKERKNRASLSSSPRTLQKRGILGHHHHRRRGGGGGRRLHYLEWCLDDVKASELKEGKRKASPKCGFASYDRYATVSRSGSRYTLATHHRSAGYTQNASRKFIRSQTSVLLYHHHHWETTSQQMLTKRAYPFFPPSFLFRSH